jgi:hypothetical protein
MGSAFILGIDIIAAILTLGYIGKLIIQGLLLASTRQSVLSDDFHSVRLSLSSQCIASKVRL